MKKVISDPSPVFLLTPLVLLAFAAALISPAKSQGGGGLTLPFSGSVTSPNIAFEINNNGSGRAISGYSAGGLALSGNTAAGVGIYGFSGTGSGLRGETNGGIGVAAIDYASGNNVVFATGPYALYAKSAGALAAQFEGAVYLNGKLGIGVSAPAVPLNFDTNLGDKIALWRSAQTGSMFGLGVQAGLFQFYTSTNGADFAFGSGKSAAFAEVLRIKGNGNVGIGVASPSAKLDVAGTARMTGFQLTTGAVAGRVLTSDANGVGTWQTAGGGGGGGWGLTGNSGTDPFTNFLGTTDFQAFEIRVNNSRALRLEPVPNNTSVNTIGGYGGNMAQGFGETVFGGNSQAPNRVSGYFSTVSGGKGNTASGYYVTVGGGSSNTASGDHATVGGGGHNTASGYFATVSGGDSNTASGRRATVCGGQSNTAAGNYSFAAGFRAKANHDGTFVWADSQDADFASVRADTFLIRAQGGVGIGTNDPTTALHVAGTITGTVKNFMIDHPLDPENKYLVHSCVESAEMKNLYDGAVTTDAKGYATVTVPDWFCALNKDFRYQLTIMDDGSDGGEWAAARVAQKLHDNRFVIRTSRPRVEVFWQVTGVRQDAYAKAHPLVVEQDKPASQRGTYLHPKEWGQPESRGASYSPHALPDRKMTRRPGR